MTETENKSVFIIKIYTQIRKQSYDKLVRMEEEFISHFVHYRKLNEYLPVLFSENLFILL